MLGSKRPHRAEEWHRRHGFVDEEGRFCPRGELHRHYHEFARHYRHFRYLHPAALVFNLLLIYLLFTWAGQDIALLFAGLIIIKEIVQFIFLLRLKQRIFYPLEKLRQGLNEVAAGNYATKVMWNKPNYLGFLIHSFNEMTGKLAEGEKRQAEYEANRKALIANISHDLKTPLTAIRGYVEGLQDQAAVSPEEQARYLQTIHRNIIHVNCLLDDLFLFAKLDMQKLEFVLVRTDLAAYLQDVIEEYRFELAEQGGQLLYTNELTGDAWVALDGKRFYQALGNLISNALQHGPAELVLTVRLYETGGDVAIDIRDNGPGIAPECLPFIFDRFYRVQRERPKTAGGSGLGLAIARELVESHGGFISAANMPEEGACFTITLPRYRQEEDEQL